MASPDLPSHLCFVSCQHDRHAEAILAILNEAIANSTAPYDYHPRPFSSMRDWFAVKEANQFPVIGIENQHGKLLGFGSYGIFRNWAAYQYTVEHSLYVEKEQRGQGLGYHLLSALIKAATVGSRHVMIGGIDTGNQASIALHLKLGFKHVGTLPQIGYKFDRWLDLAFYQLMLA